MATVLVESYGPCACAGELETIAARVRAAAEAAGLGYVRSIFVPDDETCFHVFEAPSVAVVRDALERAELSAQRVVEAVSDEPAAHDNREREKK
jgi:hypothetical protein